MKNRDFLRPTFFVHYEGDSYLRDAQGYLITSEEIQKVFNEIVGFYKEYSDEEIREINKKIDEEKRAEYKKNMNPPTKNKHKFSVGYVYFAKNEDDKIKIGRTINLKGRMKSLNTSSPHTIDLVAYFETNSSVELEEATQKYFNENKIKGEWFDINTDDIRKFAVAIDKDIIFLK